MTMQTRAAGAGLVLLSLLLPGCAADDPPPPQTTVAVCLGTALGDLGERDVVFSFEQDGEQVTRVTGPATMSFSVGVPAGKVTTVRADGDVFGQVGVDTPEGRDLAEDDVGLPADGYALSGPGCPDPIGAAGEG
ncbi:hypothetical protein [Kineococcus gynurae]|uniref:Lipoprotein n=1 Tax=Kineococcus gynurae TaxID=452979 RepID=A0ABV5LRH8_9ACTN